MIRNRALSRIAARLLTFNLLVLFLPIAAILYLDVYEARLLDSQERSMDQQARIVAAALGRGDSFDSTSATEFLRALEQRPDSRLQIYDRDGGLLADSNRIRYAGEPAGGQSTYPPASAGTRERALYRLGAAIAGLRRMVGDLGRRTGAHPAESTGTTDSKDAPAEVRTALR